MREADVVVDAEVVALAGHDHVVVAVEPHLARPPGLPRAERGERRPLRRLALLAAEAAAHAPHLDGDRVVVEAEHMGDDVLHLGRVLGRGMDEHVAVLAGDGERDLAFEVEMLLPADAELAGDLASARGSISSAGSPRLEAVVGEDRASRRPSASSTSITGIAGAVAMRASLAARRAWSRVSATTTNSTWP